MLGLRRYKSPSNLLGIDPRVAARDRICARQWQIAGNPTQNFPLRELHGGQKLGEQKDATKCT